MTPDLAKMLIFFPASPSLEASITSPNSDSIALSSQNLSDAVLGGILHRKCRYGFSPPCHARKPHTPFSTLTTSPTALDRLAITEPIVLFGSTELIFIPLAFRCSAISVLLIGRF